MATMAKAIRPAPGAGNADGPSMPKPVRIAPAKAPSTAAKATTTTTKATPALKPARIAIAPGFTAASSSSPVLAKAPLIAPAPSTQAASTPSPGSTSGTLTPLQSQTQPAGATLQPSQVWVLPARAKPGRKPSEDEPPTKRKAQNRASQRAFRERKQSYLAELEAKVQAYEAQGVQQSVELQKAAQKVKDENEVLKRENGKLKAQCAHLIKVLQGLGWNGSSKGSTKNVGCRPPSHEGAVGTARGAPSTAAPSTAGSPPRSRASSISGRGQSSGPSAASTSAVKLRGAKEAGSKAKTTVASAQAAPVAVSPSPSTSSKVSYTPTPAPITCTGSTQTCACAPSQQACAPKPATSSKGQQTGGSGETEAPFSSGLDMGMAEDRNCGFCTADVPCLCAGEAVLDLDGGDEDKAMGGEATFDLSAPSVATPTSTGISTDHGTITTSDGDASNSEAVPIRLRRREQAVTLGSMLNEDAPPRRTSSSSSPSGSTTSKLWHTVAHPTASSSTDAAPLRRPLSVALASKRSSSNTLAPLSHLENARLAARPPKPRLWHLENGFVAPPQQVAGSLTAPATPTAVCSGDPRSCSACSTDPGLAAFCEAVSSDDTPSKPTKRTGGPGSASIPAPGPEARSVPLARRTTGDAAPSVALPSLRSVRQGEGVLWRLDGASTAKDGPQTIPEAWHRIRSHPGFLRWQALQGAQGSGDGEMSASGAAPASNVEAQLSRTRPGLPFRRSAGLDMLADVVAGRTDAGLVCDGDGDAHAHALVEDEDGHDGGMQIDMPSPERPISSERTKTGSKRRHGVEGDQDGPTVEEERNATDEVDARDATATPKRRRLYVEGDRVRLALALLNRGILSPSGPNSPSSPSFGSGQSIGSAAMERGTSSGASGGAHGEKLAPCPCPWWKTEPAGARGNGEAASRGK